MLSRFAVALLAGLILVAPMLAEERPPDPPTGVIDRALSWLGVRYRFGGSDEKRGFDCAGLVRRAYSSIGVELPRTAALQYGQGCIVEREELRAGDLVFFKNTYKRGISHVGIYIGEGRFVHAASTGKRVRVDSVDAAYYRKRFAGGRRIVEDPALLAPPMMEPAIELAGAVVEAHAATAAAPAGN